MLLPGTVTSEVPVPPVTAVQIAGGAPVCVWVHLVHCLVSVNPKGLKLWLTPGMLAMEQVWHFVQSSAFGVWFALGIFPMSQFTHFVQSAVVGVCAVSASSKSYGQLVHVFDTVQSSAFALFDVWVEFAASIS